MVTGWVPTSDAGYFTVRSRDVLTADHPWLGAWSSASASVGETIRNLGPLQLDLLAPFTKVDAYSGTAIGVGVTAAASVIAVWWSAHRVLGPVGAGAAMLATLALEAAIGSQVSIDPRQQIYLLMPYWALLWLTWATAAGRGAAIAPLVFTASLIVQTHLTYLFQTVLLVAVGIGLYVANVRSRWSQANATRHLLVGLLVALMCWAQPLWDQFAGEGNLGAVLANRGTGDGVGWTEGTQVIASTVLLPPRFWMPGTVWEALARVDLAPHLAALLALAIWMVLLAAAVLVAVRSGQRTLAGLAGIAFFGLVAAVVAGSRIPTSVFGILPQNYFWMWPTGVFLTVGLVAGLSARSAVVRTWFVSRIGAVAICAAGLVMVVVASRPIDNFASVAGAATAGTRVARPVVDQLAVWLRVHDIEGPLVVDYSRASFDSYVRTVFLAELQRAGIEFVFEPGDENIRRFGRRRCAEGDALSRIVLADAGGSLDDRDGEIVVAHVDAFSDTDEAELAALDRQFGDWLRDGTVVVDLDDLEFLAHRELPELRRVLSTPGLPATGVARTLGRWTTWIVLDVPDDRRGTFNRWVDLEVGAALDQVKVSIAPPSADSADRRSNIDNCPT